MEEGLPRGTEGTLLLKRQILIGDVMEKIMEIPSDSVDLMVTSPPYLWLRDYGFEGQWGLEENIEDYQMKMLLLMNQVKRVIKPTGNIVVNMGDVYGGGTVHSDWSPGKDAKYENFVYSDKRTAKMKFKTTIKKPYPNSLCFIPFEFGMRCVRELGLCCHNIIPWIKLNPMPFSGKNRFMNMWEPVFWFTKKPSKYYFNLDAVRIRPKILDERWVPKIKSKKGQTKLFGSDDGENERKTMNIPGQTAQGIHRNRSEGKPDFEAWSEDAVRKGRGSNNEGLNNRNFMPIKKQDSTPMADGKPDPTKAGFNERWKNRKTLNIPGQGQQTVNQRSSHGHDMETGEYIGNPNGKNPGDILVTATQPYPDAHYATFPLDIPRYYISCMCPPKGVVLDVFAGSGTTAEAAEQLNRDWILIEGFEENLKLINKRLEPYRNVKLD